GDRSPFLRERILLPACLAPSLPLCRAWRARVSSSQAWRPPFRTACLPRGDVASPVPAPAPAVNPCRLCHIGDSADDGSECFTRSSLPTRARPVAVHVASRRALPRPIRAWHHACSILTRRPEP